MSGKSGKVSLVGCVAVLEAADVEVMCDEGGRGMEWAVKGGITAIDLVDDVG